MSSPRATLTALAVAAVLGAGYWGWNVKLKPQRAKAKEDAKKLFAGLQAGETREILLRKKGSEDVLLRKVDSAWRLLKPIQAPADAAAVEALVRSLADAGREEVVVEKDAVLRTYGLDQPSGAVTFTPASPGAKAQALFFGNDNPTGSYAYAMIDGKPEVFLTWLSVKNAVLKDADGLRDKAPWSFEPEEVESLDSTQGGGFSLRRSESGGWTVRRAGADEPGLEQDVDAWLRQLAAFRALHVPSEDGKGGAWGTAKGPRIRIRLKGGAQLELSAGKAKGSDGFYAQGRPGGPVFELPASDLLTMQKDGVQLCDRLAFRLQSGQVERFEVKRPAGTLTAVKSAGAWAWDPAPAAKGKEFDFDGFLSRFQGASLLQRLDPKARPATPTASVLFYGSGGVPLETVDFGPRRGGGVLAYSGERRWASVVAANLLDGLPEPVTAAAAAKP